MRPLIPNQSCVTEPSLAFMLTQNPNYLLGYCIDTSDVLEEIKYTYTIDWESNVRKSKTCSEIILIFKLMNMNKIAERLDFMNNFIQEDPNEPQIVFKSLREMAIFILELQLPKPLIGLTDDGFIVIQWHIPPNGLLAMDFLPTKEIEYIAIYPESKEGVKQKIICETSSKEKVLNTISSLTPLLNAQ